MLASGTDASAASLQVGYQSASQFSRECRRLFGKAPSQDISRLREEGLAQPREPQRGYLRRARW